MHLLHLNSSVNLSPILQSLKTKVNLSIPSEGALSWAGTSVVIVYGVETFTGSSVRWNTPLKHIAPWSSDILNMFRESVGEF